MSETKRFAILVYGSGEGVAQLSEAERQAHMQQWDNWVSKLQADHIFCRWQSTPAGCQNDQW